MVTLAPSLKKIANKSLNRYAVILEKDSCQQSLFHFQTDFNYAKKSTLLLRWWDGASIAETKHLWGVDSRVVCMHYMSMRWAPGEAHSPVGPLPRDAAWMCLKAHHRNMVIPCTCSVHSLMAKSLLGLVGLLCLKRWLKVDFRRTHLPGCLDGSLPRSPHAQEHCCLHSHHPTAVPRHCRGGNSSPGAATWDCGFVAHTGSMLHLEGNTSAALVATPKALQEGCEWGARREAWVQVWEAYLLVFISPQNIKDGWVFSGSPFSSKLGNTLQDWGFSKIPTCKTQRKFFSQNDASF